jgi:hypothetical protein
MASSRPAALVLGDDDDDWGVLSSLPSSTSRVSTTSSAVASGEFNAFTSIGVSVAGGGPKRELWVFSEDKSPCLGKVGVNNNKFCVKPRLEGLLHCGTGRHSVKFQPEKDVAYIKVTENQVYSSPVLALDQFTPSQKEKILKWSFQAAEWEADLKAFADGAPPSWMVEILESEDEHSEKEEQVSVDLITPSGARAKQGVFDIIPTFSFDSLKSDEFEDKEDIGDESVVPTADSKLLKMEAKILKLKGKLTRPFLDIDASYTIMVKDVHKLHDKIKTIGNYVGSYPGGFKDSAMNLSKMVYSSSVKISDLVQYNEKVSPWLSTIQSAIDSIQVTLDSVQEEVAEVQNNPTQIDQWMDTTNKTLDLFNKRLVALKGYVLRGNGSGVAGKENINANIAPDPFAVTRGGSNSSDTLYRRILDLEEKIKLLENRVVGAGVQLGNLVFQSFDDLLAWVRVKVPKGRFGLFVDGHSFLEFFSISGHIDTEAGTAAFSHSQKAGFTTYIEAQLAMSFKNLFPMVFGKGGAASLDDSESLPAISNGDKWNNGSTGIHHQLMRNMNDVSYQLDSSIKKVLKDHPEARQLAIDCVTAAKRFVIDLIAFMSQEYSTWQTRGFSKKDAWLIVCQIIRRIFEDLQSARISARNAHDFDDMDFTTATFIYATLRCHDVMEGYVKHQFHAHPHVSSVITRHLAANFVKPEHSQDSKVATLETKVKTLGTKVDSVVSKVELLVSKEKDKHKNEKEKGKKFKGRAEEVEN